jgi:hypothetical protein
MQNDTTRVEFILATPILHELDELAARTALSRADLLRIGTTRLLDSGDKLIADLRAIGLGLADLRARGLATPAPNGSD